MKAVYFHEHGGPDVLRYGEIDTPVPEPGEVLVVGDTSGYATEIGFNYIFGKHLRIIGSTMAPQADFRTVMSLVFEGKLQPIIGKVLPLSEASTAHELLEVNELFGKVVLNP